MRFRLGQVPRSTGMDTIPLEQTLTIRLADGTSFTVASNAEGIAALCTLLRQARSDGAGVGPGTVIDGTVATLDYVGENEEPVAVSIPVFS